ncbi:MAG: cupin domain-containing protein [Paludisphaera borealis]|uniref:cupin domain-containing protein n=1 Tax=Paludisphaera borealis TaxID=1387353 RepID=UPI00284107D0|nr:cupin domain-containing protein [Paludisphaera borealis]MDR3619643.1 cupin domain-containing protein [Paludisphaera borealis]
MNNRNRIVASTLLTLAGLGGVLAVRAHEAAAGAKITQLIGKEIAETLDGKKAQFTMTEVAYEPGQGSDPHRHPGPILGYVLEGEYEFGINDQDSKILKVGDTFYEPTGTLHRVSRNPSATGRTRVLAVSVSPQGAKRAAPAKPKDEK